MRSLKTPMLMVLTLASGLAVTQALAQQANMTFFVTSAGKGDGANLGDLEGADAHCQALAKVAGATKTNWRAYLSTTAPGGEAGVNARDRIGKGPWQNAKGTVIAKSVDDLHSDAGLTKETILTEKGEVVSGRGDPVNMHDILVRIPTACTRRPEATQPVAIGRRTAMARPSSGIMIASASKTRGT